MFIILIIGIVVSFILLKPKENSSVVNHELTNEFDPIITKNEDGSYRIFGAEKNQTFEVEPGENFEFKITDEEGKEVSTTTTANENKVTINAPESLYEEGKEYKLNISNGTFTNEELKEVKEILFSIKRNSSNSYKFKEGIKQINENDIKVNDSILTTNNEYKKNDIIIVKENDNIKSYYKVEKKNDNGTYEVSVPKIEEVYDEFDFYGIETLDLSSFETDDSLKDYIAYEVKKSVLDYFVEEVQAKTKIEIKDPKYDTKTGKLTLTVKISSEAGDTVFGNKFLDSHDMELELKATIRIDAYNDVWLGSFDTGMKLYLELTPKAKLDFRDKDLAKYREDIKEALKQDTKNWNTSWLNNDYKNIKKDSVNYEPKLGKLAIPTSIPGIYVNFTTGLLFKFDVKASLEASVTTKIEANFGLRMNCLGKKNGLYGYLESSGNMTGSFAGEVETKVGLKTSLGVEWANIAYIKGTLGSGLYTDAKWTLSSKTNNAKKEVTTTLESKLEGGLFSEFKLEGKALMFDGSLKIYDGKAKLIDEKSSFEVAKVSLEKDEPVVKPVEDKPQTPDKPQDKPVVEDKYYTVTLYHMAYCCDNSPYNICDSVKNFKVKKGTTIKNSEVYNSLPWSADIDNVMYYHTYLNRSKKYNELLNQNKACEDACYAEAQANGTYGNCYNVCKQKYDPEPYYGLKNDFDINKPINENTSIIIQVGCGAAE